MKSGAQSRLMKLTKYEKRKREWAKEEAAMRRLADLGTSFADIAKHYGVSRQAVQKRLSRT